MEINTKIHQVLDPGANPNPGAGPVPLQEGVSSTRVSMFGPISVSYAILSYHCTHILAQGLGGACNELWDANLLEDTVRREVSRASNEKMWAWGERERARRATRRATNERGGGGGYPY
jgi:hypothetical protein